MKLDVKTLDGGTAGSVDLPETIFGLAPRPDLVQRMVLWQLAKRQAGTHKTKGRAEIWRTGKKLYKQKGSGNARHGSARVAQFRGGGRAFGPVVRSHAHDLTKKVRSLALRHALSAKLQSGSVIILDEAKLDAARPALCSSTVQPLKPTSHWQPATSRISMCCLFRGSTYTTSFVATLWC